MVFSCVWFSHQTFCCCFLSRSCDSFAFGQSFHLSICPPVSLLLPLSLSLFSLLFCLLAPISHRTRSSQSRQWFDGVIYMECDNDEFSTKKKEIEKDGNRRCNWWIDNFFQLIFRYLLPYGMQLCLGVVFAAHQIA